MSAALRRKMTREEFIAWEETQEGRFEYDGVTVEAMVGGTLAHSIIKVNIAIAIGSPLRGSACRFLDSDAKVVTAQGTRYPDGMIVCGPIRETDTGTEAPVVIFEVLSPSTALKDLTVKNDEYRAIPSVRQYVLLDQDRVAATVFFREGENWVGQRLTGLDASLALDGVGLAPIALGALYEGLSFASERSSGT